MKGVAPFLKMIGSLWKKVYYPPPKKLGNELKRDSLGE
jgi:hypothetical protein